MKCEELLRMINEYVDGTLEPGLCRDLEGHISGCDPCTVVIDNIRRTIKLYRGDEVIELPDVLRDRLRGALRRRWEELQQRRACDGPRPSGEASSRSGDEGCKA